MGKEGQTIEMAVAVIKNILLSHHVGLLHLMR